MYGGIKGPGAGIAFTGGAGGALAFTGLPIIGLTLVAIALLMVGFIVARVALVRRSGMRD
jgi:hypothetical protein